MLHTTFRFQDLWQAHKNGGGCLKEQVTIEAKRKCDWNPQNEDSKHIHSVPLRVPFVCQGRQTNSSSFEVYISIFLLRRDKTKEPFTVRFYRILQYPASFPAQFPPGTHRWCVPLAARFCFGAFFFQHLGEVQRLRIYQRRSPVSGWKHITHSQIGSSSQAGIQKNHWNHHLNHVLNYVFDHVWCCFPPPNHYLYEVTWGQYMKVTQHLDHVWGEDATMS